MDEIQFTNILTQVCEVLSKEALQSTKIHPPREFEKRVRTVVSEVLVELGESVSPDIEQGFPDIVVGEFGIEVKATQGDSWRCIANSISEGQRALNVEQIFVVYGKFGGEPKVKWADYGSSIRHVRTSHVPRFEIEIDTENPLFDQLNISYDEFRKLTMDDKMPFIRDYARGRLKAGERLWWLDNDHTVDQEHSLPLGVRSILQLSKEEKLRVRAEATLLVPNVFSRSRSSEKSAAYVDVAMYLMTYRGILAHQTRDFFTAGSVGQDGPTGNFIRDATNRIQDEIRDAAEYLEDGLFLEYWGSIPERSQIIFEWLKRADESASDWRPSDELFLEEQGKVN